MIQIRPRSSKVIATGLTMSGSPATSSTWNPSGTVIRAIASAGDSGGLGAGPGHAARPGARIGPGKEDRRG